MDRFVIRKIPPPRISVDDLAFDPAKRKKIQEYDHNQIDEVRRIYLTRGPCQPRGHTFKQKSIGGVWRRFNPQWFDQYPDWLEYSVEQEKAFCLFCYLFRVQVGKQGGSDTFVSTGFSSWNKVDSFSKHVGDHSSFHNDAKNKCEDLMRQGQSIKHALHKQTDIVKSDYRIRLGASIDVCRHLLHQGLSFRAHDEKEESTNKGNFLELLKYTARQNEAVKKVVLHNAPKNNQMTSPPIQKDIAHCFAEEVTKSVIQEINNDVFGLLVDESADVSDKEQMAVVFRFVDKFGLVKERFIGISHVKDTSSLTLKYAIDALFAKHGLSLKKVRGQGYDGASNMKGEFNGLRSLILKESRSAYYVHCFAHQLQLVVVAVAKKHVEVGEFFDMVHVLLNAVGASCKRKLILTESNRKRMEEGISKGTIKTGTGLNQDLSLKRPGNTRWGSHYKTLLRLGEMFPCIIEVLEHIQTEGMDGSKRQQAFGLLKYFHTFDCVFYLQLMLVILGLTNNLSKALQKRDQEILNAVSLVGSTKRQLQKLRDEGWENFVATVYSFSENNKTEVLDMEEEFVDSSRPRKKTGITNLHHYKVDCFYTVLDMQLQEFNDRFDEVNSELLVCMASLSPIDSFRQFDKSMLMRLAELYQDDFSSMERRSLEQQLDIYLDNVQKDERFTNLESLGDLARVLVDTRKHLSHPLVYRLLKLCLILPVATASVERCFSAMNIVKTTSRNSIGDEFLSDCLVCFIEKQVLETVTNETVIKRFQDMSERRVHL
ncbi:zinc finger MYM-type protein 1-like [Brassica napus]|uniref:zinc finger MYM-type protein 1-like n=1 Tax=Brassica napus TaxID=3708 RepID=UPI002078F455|nr:zinc finger MYM-type protein 1-like [Brassica napus]